MKISDILYLSFAAIFLLFWLAACGAAAGWLERQGWYQNFIMGGVNMAVSKRLTRKSGITIPKHIRAESGFFPGMAVDIETVEEGVLIRKRIPVCQFCGNAHDVVKVHGMELCGQCAAAIRKELESIGA